MVVTASAIRYNIGHHLFTIQANEHFCIAVKILASRFVRCSESRAGCDDAERRRLTGISAKKAATKTSNGRLTSPAAKGRGRRISNVRSGPRRRRYTALSARITARKRSSMVLVAIAKNVRGDLRNNGIDARLIRTSICFIPLYDQRWRSPISTAPICFMSIHADGFTSPERRRRLGVRPVKPRRQ